MNPLLTNHLIGFALVSIVLPLVAVIVYFNRSRHILKSIFAFYTLAISWWAFFTMFMITAGDGRWGMFWDRMCLTGTVFIPSSFFHFIIAYTRESDRLKNLIRTNYGISLLFLVVLWFTPWFIKDVAPKFGMNYFSVPGPLYLVFVVFFLECVVGAMYFLWNFQKGLPPSRLKKQAQYLFWFSVIGYGGGSCNYLLVYDINLPGVAETSNYGVLILSIAIAYIIFRFQFLDIEVIIKKTIVFAGIVAAAVSVIAFPFALIQAVIGKALGVPNPFVLMAFGIATAVLIYRPLERRLVDLTDRFLFQKKYNYHKLLKENSKQLSFIKSLDEMARQIVTFLIKQGRIRSAGILMRSPDQKRFELRHPLGYGGRRNRPSFSMENDHALVRLLAERKTPLVLEKLEKEAKDIPSEFSVLEEIREVMKRLKAEVIIPSFLGNSPNNQVKNNDSGLQLRNLLVLGPKKSDEEYTDEDLDVFFTIAQDAAIAAENARLFDLILKERESRLKAESEARLATYGKSTAHESKNAMAGLYDPAQFMMIYGYTDLKKIYERFLRGKLPPGAEKKFSELLETMKQKGELIFTKADELLIIAKTGEGTLSSDEKQFQKFNLKMVWDAAKAEAKTGPCKLIRYVPDYFYPHGNVILIKRVFINLMNNAAEAMKYVANGEIILRARHEEIDGKKVTLFEFSDNGSGIPPEDLEKIWEFGWSTKPKPQFSDIEASGRGQGLWRVKDTIENIHGGKIWVESAPGKGTTFKFWIPFKKDESVTDIS